MAIKKHNLTTGKDVINGNGGSDLFVALLVGGDPTLSNLDLVDGMGGLDRLSAVVTEEMLRPNARRIEVGTFTYDLFSAATLDLKRAAAMTTVVLKNAPDITLQNVTRLSSLDCLAMQDDVGILMRGLDTTQVKKLSVAVSNTTGLELDVDPLVVGSVLGRLDLSLNRSDILLHSDLVARTIAVHSKGTGPNFLTYVSLADDNRVRKMVIDGAADFSFEHSFVLTKLAEIDASNATGTIRGSLDLPFMALYQGGSGSDQLALRMTANPPGHAQATDTGKTHVNLGKGSDLLNAIGEVLDSSSIVVNGGGGNDTVLLSKGIANSSGLFHGVEKLVISQAAGEYDLAGSGARIISFSSSAAADTVIKGLQSEAILNFSHAQAAGVSIAIAGAKLSKTDVLHVNIDAPTAANASGSMTVGSFTKGLQSLHLSNLEIESTSQGSAFGNLLALASVGSASNPVTVTISGDHAFSLFSTDTAKSYIQKLVIENDAGVNVVGLAWGLQAFDAGGATVIGAGGDDALVGGAGNDLIRTGAGNNEVYGSGGVDKVFLLKDAGTDVLHFSDFSQSTMSGKQDIVHNFNVFDTIDLHSLVDNLLFKGNFNDLSSGIAGLSTAFSSAFFCKADHALYVDVNHDGQLDGQHDLSVVLADVSSISGFNLVT